MKTAFRKAANWIENRVIAVIPGFMLTPSVSRSKHARSISKTSKQFLGTAALIDGLAEKIVGNIRKPDYAAYERNEMAETLKETAKKQRRLQSSVLRLDAEREKHGAFWLLRGAPGLSGRTSAKLQNVLDVVMSEHKLRAVANDLVDELGSNSTVRMKSSLDLEYVSHAACVLNEHIPSKSRTRALLRLTPQ